MDHTKLKSKRGREGPNSRIPDRRENMKLSDSFIGSFLVSQNLMMGKKNSENWMMTNRNEMEEWVLIKISLAAFFPQNEREILIFIICETT